MKINSATLWPFDAGGAMR